MFKGLFKPTYQRVDEWRLSLDKAEYLEGIIFSTKTKRDFAARPDSFTASYFDQKEILPCDTRTNVIISNRLLSGQLFLMETIGFILRGVNPGCEQPFLKSSRLKFRVDNKSYIDFPLWFFELPKRGRLEFTFTPDKPLLITERNSFYGEISIESLDYFQDEGFIQMFLKGSYVENLTEITDDFLGCEND